MITQASRYSESHVRTNGRTDEEAIEVGGYLNHPGALASELRIRLVVAR